MKTLITIVLLLALVPGLAMAGNWTADNISLSGKTGTGNNTSYLVVDFGSASYAFQYKWNYITEDAPTGFDLLNAASAGVPGLSFTSHTSGGMGAMIDSISYDGHTASNSTESDWWNYPSWNYWTGAVGGPIAYSRVGVSTSSLSNGSVDAWVFTGDWNQAPQIPGVPEPSSLMAMCSLIGLAGSVGLLRKLGHRG